MKSPDVIFALPVTFALAEVVAKILREQGKMMQTKKRSSTRAMGKTLREMAAFLTSLRFEEWDAARKRLEKAKR